jgi:hypothetical protein
MGLSLPIRLQWSICAQGHEVVEVPRKGKAPSLVLRERTSNREPVSYGPGQSDRPIFPEFAAIDATDPYAFVDFCDRFGMPWPEHFGADPVEHELTGAQFKAMEPAQSVVELRRALTWAKAGTAFKHVVDLQMTIARGARAKLKLALWLEGENDPGVEPYLAPSNLLGFIWCEFLASIGTMREMRRCEVCGTMFAVGQGSGHRRSRVYCSTRCRVAASRARASVGKNTGV